MLNIKSQLHRIILLFSCFMLLKTAHSQNIPDANFAAAIRAQCPTCIDANNNLTASAQTLENLNVRGKGITNLAGIGGFTALRKLNCSQNDLMSLPPLPIRLRELDCSNNYFLIGLPALPSGLLVLRCHYTLIYCLPNLPPNLFKLQINYSYDNPYIHCVPNNGNSGLIVSNENDTEVNYVSCSNPPIAPTFSPPSVTHVLCNGSNTGKIKINATGNKGATIYTISPEVGTQSPAGTFNNLPAGTYVIEARNYESCTTTSFTTKITQPSAIVSTKCYAIINKNSGKYLTTTSTALGASIVQLPNLNSVAQKWRFTPTLTAGNVKIVGQNNGRVVHNSGIDGENCVQTLYIAGMGDWKLECQSTGLFKITHGLSGKALTVENASTLDKAPIEVKTWTGANNQLWQIVETTCPAISYNLVANTDGSNTAAEVKSTDLTETEIATGNIEEKHTPSVYFTLYPNPATNEAFINLQGYEGQVVRIVLSDVSGKTIQQERVESASTEPYRLDLKPLQSGLFFVKVQGQDGHSMTHKLQILK